MTYQITDACTGCGVCARYCPVLAISGAKKAQHVIDASVCINCGTCGRVCAFSAVLDEKGQLTSRVKQSQWLKPTWKENACVACNACVQACPVSVIGTIIVNGRVGQAPYPYLADAKSCVGCSFCADACPINVIEMLVLVAAH